MTQMLHDRGPPKAFHASYRQPGFISEPNLFAQLLWERPCRPSQQRTEICIRYEPVQYARFTESHRDLIIIPTPAEGADVFLRSAQDLLREWDFVVKGPIPTIKFS